MQNRVPTAARMDRKQKKVQLLVTGYNKLIFFLFLVFPRIYDKNANEGHKGLRKRRRWALGYWVWKSELSIGRVGWKNVRLCHFYFKFVTPSI